MYHCVLSVWNGVRSKTRRFISRRDKIVFILRKEITKFFMVYSFYTWAKRTKPHTHHTRTIIISSTYAHRTHVSVWRALVHRVRISWSLFNVCRLSTTACSFFVQLIPVSRLVWRARDAMKLIFFSPHHSFWNNDKQQKKKWKLRRIMEISTILTCRRSVRIFRRTIFAMPCHAQNLKCGLMRSITTSASMKKEPKNNNNWNTSANYA